jgi:hypothetical protein
MIDALLQREHRSYREIGHLSVRHVLNRVRIEHTEDEVRWLVSGIERLRCFPEVPAARARLQTKRPGIRHHRDRLQRCRGVPDPCARLQWPLYLDPATAAATAAASMGRSPCGFASACRRPRRGSPNAGDQLSQCHQRGIELLAGHDGAIVAGADKARQAVHAALLAPLRLRPRSETPYGRGIPRLLQSSVGLHFAELAHIAVPICAAFPGTVCRAAAPARFVGMR